MDPLEGQFQLDVHISDADTTTYTIQFEAGDGPFTSAQLDTHISGAISTNPAFDKVIVSVTGGALVFQMGERHVRAGSFIRINEAGSDPDVLDALGLDKPDVDLAMTELTARGGEFPVTLATAATLTLSLTYEDGSVEDFDWTMPAGSTFNDAAALAAAHGGDLANATISAVGGELHFDLTAGQPDPVAAITASETGPWDLDNLGLDRIVIQEGLVTKAKTNTVKYNRTLLAGQAVAAYMLNELTRVDAGPDAIPNIAFEAANEAALTQAFLENVDYDGTPDRPYSSYVLVFLDVVGKRAGASGGFIDAGVENGGYLFTHQLHGAMQIIYQATSSGTVAHETGHNFGFPDLYDNSSGNYDPNLRYPFNWDIMHRSVLNHPGAWMKGFFANWIQNDGGNIEVFPMPSTPGVETKKFALTPLEFGTAAYDDLLAGLPGDIDAVAKAVRLPIGFDAGAAHHFLFLQNRQQGQAYSNSLPMVPGAPSIGGVYLTDTISQKVFDYFTITARNFAHPLTDMPDVFVGPQRNVRPILDMAPAQDVNVLMTYPAYAGLNIDIVDTIPGPGGLANRATYIVEIEREQSDFLDLAINPWSAPPYESVDIWIEHGDKDAADLSTAPLPGNGEPARWAADYDPAANGGKPLNWVRVKVTNNGTVDATDVQVKVKVNTPGAMGASGSWAELDLSEPLDVPAGASMIFNVPWNPEVSGHTCIQAEIFRWTSSLGEVDYTNNGTQENVNDFQPTAGSPWHPAPFSVDVENPFDNELVVYLEAEGLRPGFSVQWDEANFTVAPRSKTRRTGVLNDRQCNRADARARRIRGRCVLRIRL